MTEESFPGRTKASLQTAPGTVNNGPQDAEGARVQMTRGLGGAGGGKKKFKKEIRVQHPRQACAPARECEDGGREWRNETPREKKAQRSKNKC